MPHAVSDPADTKYCIAISDIPSVSKFDMDKCLQSARDRKIPVGKNIFWAFKSNVLVLWIKCSNPCQALLKIV